MHQKTTKHHWNKLKKTYTNGKTYHIHGLKDLILLKCQWYQKQSTDLIQSLWKSQWYFLKKQEKKIIQKFTKNLEGLWAEVRWLFWEPLNMQKGRTVIRLNFKYVFRFFKALFWLFFSIHVGIIAIFFLVDINFVCWKMITEWLLYFCGYLFGFMVQFLARR